MRGSDSLSYHPTRSSEQIADSFTQFPSWPERRNQEMEDEVAIDLLPTNGQSQHLYFPPRRSLSFSLSPAPLLLPLLSL